MTLPSSSQASNSALGVLQQLEETRIQRELAIAQLLERRRKAYKLAEEREKLNWSASGGLVTTLLSALSSYHHKNLLHLLPIVPIATYLGYKMHFCYGSKIAVVEKKALEMVHDGEQYSHGSKNGTEIVQPCYRARRRQFLKKFADERLEEEITLQNIKFEQKMASRLAERREQFSWELMAAGTMTAILFFAGSVYKRKDLVIPIAPLIMGVGYRYDAAYGTQSNVLRESAEKLLREDSHRFQPVGGPLTLAQVDAFRQRL